MYGGGSSGRNDSHGAFWVGSGTSGRRFSCRIGCRGAFRGIGNRSKDAGASHRPGGGWSAAFSIGTRYGGWGAPSKCQTCDTFENNRRCRLRGRFLSTCRVGNGVAHRASSGRTPASNSRRVLGGGSGVALRSCRRRGRHASTPRRRSITPPAIVGGTQRLHGGNVVARRQCNCPPYVCDLSIASRAGWADRVACRRWTFRRGNGSSLPYCISQNTGTDARRIHHRGAV